MKHPLAERYERPVGRGATLPQLFVVEGKGLCVVKFLQNPQGNRALPNELIGFKLATALGIDHPEVGIVEVIADVLPNTRTLEVEDEYGEKWVFKPGVHLYSRWLEPVTQAEATDLLPLAQSSPENIELLASVVVLDLLLSNWDRKPLNLNLLIHREGRHRLKLVDLSMAFGNANWMLGNLLKTDLPPLDERLPYSGDLDDVLRMVNPDTDFTSVLAKLSKLTRKGLEATVASVPPDWGVTEREKQALVDYLEKRSAQIPDYLSERLQKQEWWR